MDKKESRLVDLVADGSMPQAKVCMKLIELKSERKRIEAQLANISEQLGIGAKVLTHAFDLIATPFSLYRDSSPEVRRHLNETFYRRFYIDDLEDTMTPQVTDEMNPVFADLHRVARICRGVQTPRSKRLASQDSHRRTAVRIRLSGWT
ncbi:hypothetical protein IRT45_35980 [Nocardia sp. BSTN01]|uniref:hypothetical protein n=1 Tax=Nocardia sp. BSTN01 TaxID=2783665 RepID=UPI00188F8896|nr:hypothetical protein [Nocardia sp. BSTN01]MBF5002515.1 hypothetical protein [Nocardia sp. BSTN01]